MHQKKSPPNPHDSQGTTSPEKVTFESLGLSRTLPAIISKGFEEPTPVQARTIPLLLSGKQDIVAQAQTGTGKTAAFALPLIETLEAGHGHVQAIVLAPTRELAVQICDEFLSLRGDSGLSVLPVYGGQSMEEQIHRLKRGIDIVVGTPGRVMDHLRRKTLNLSSVRYMILDEADEMLDRGFVEDIETILRSVNPERRMLLFSATMSARIMQIAQKYMKDTKIIKMAPGVITAALTEQVYIEVEDRDRFEALCRVIDMADDFYGLIFCRTKIEVDSLSSKLNGRGYDAEALHGDITQFQREKILAKMKQRRTKILVATDVAARGIDIQGLSHVINFSLPQNPENYIHRIGRTGRAGLEGIAVTFVSHDEYRKLNFIKRVSGSDIRREDLPEIHQIIGAKKDRLNKQLALAVETGIAGAFVEGAQRILESFEPADAIAALLSLAYGEAFDETKYRQIHKKSPGGQQERTGHSGTGQARSRYPRSDQARSDHTRSGHSRPGRFDGAEQILGSGASDNRNFKKQNRTAAPSRDEKKPSPGADRVIKKSKKPKRRDHKEKGRAPASGSAPAKKKFTFKFKKKQKNR